MIGGEIITLTGQFPARNNASGPPPEVRFIDSTKEINKDKCSVVFYNRSTITCRTNDIDPGFYNVSVYFPPDNHSGIAFGKAVWNRTIHFELYVDDVTPTTGSLVGGTALTISGKGFGNLTSLNDVEVWTGNYRCDVKHVVNDSTIECITRGIGETFHVENNAKDSGNKKYYDVFC